MLAFRRVNRLHEARSQPDGEIARARGGKQLEMERVVDLFCGAGGLSLGFTQEGFHVVAAYDSWPAAVRNYRLNLGDHVTETHISEETSIPDADLIVGGPPCQGFSSAGLRRANDQRNSLVRVFANIVAKHRPKCFVFENVEGFFTGAGGRYVLDLLEPLLGSGYQIHVGKLNAANYGVPQHRKRVIVTGGLDCEIELPTPTHTAHGAPGSLLAASHLPPTANTEEAIDGLPKAFPVENGSESANENCYRKLTGVDVDRARLLRPGMRMRDLPEEFWHGSYQRRANRRVMDGTPTERRGGAPAGLRRLIGEEPSKAITGGALNEFLHPTEDRPLTLRECARLQTFPDDFVFSGKRSEQMQLIGNAVPPAFARAIARAVKSRKRRTIQSSRGVLLSFRPTLSQGMSPALKKVTESVLEKHGTSETRGYEACLWA